MSNFVCSIDSCPVILSSICVIYQGESLIYTGINDGDSLQTALQKIDGAFADAGLGYAFQNGVIQTTPGVPVELGGSLLHDTTIGGNYKLTLAGRIEASALITTGGTSSQFVKGNGTLDSNAYQLAGNYITALTGDGTAVGPGSAALTLATVNANPGTYGTGTLVPRITVDAKGRVTSITTTAIPSVSGILVFEGDVTGSGITGAPVTLTLATVNTNVYSAITFLKFKVNAKGLVTGASPVTNLDIEGALGYVPVPNTRTITINGITQNLQANRTWTFATGVATVTASAPLASTGGANPNISITQADGSTNGYLSSTDWNTFNNKQNAIPYTPADDALVVHKAGTETITGQKTFDLSPITQVGLLLKNQSVTPFAAGYSGISADSGNFSLIKDNGVHAQLDLTGLTANREYVFPNANGTLTLTSDLAAYQLLLNGTGLVRMSGTVVTYDNTSYTPQTRTLTINGTSFDLTSDRSWTINSMVYPGAGIAVSTGTAWGTSLVDNSTDWNTAYSSRITSATAPLNITGTTISIAQAGAAANGYLSSTDWTTFNNKQASGHYITDLSGEATATGPGIATVTLSNTAVIGKVLTGVNITGGTVVATDSILQAFGKVQNQINGLVGGTIYQGVWNAATNTPTLTSGVGTDGYYYITSVAGTTNLDGISDWHVGDWAIFHGGTWQQVDNTDAVVSVNGFTGAVSLVTTDISEGTNLYFTQLRARQSISLTTTGTSGAATYNDATGILNVPQYQGGVTSFNTRTGAITLTSLDVTNALVYTPVTNARTLTINGTTYDLTADRTWSIDSMIYPAAGIALSTGTAWGTSITDNSADWNTAYTSRISSLTTTGSSGAATLSSNVLNIPNYTLSGLGGVPTTRTITINSTAYDLSADRTWNVGTVTSVAALTLGTTGTDLSSTVATGTTTPVITLNVPTASAANRGALSAADWTTFNNKASTAALANYLPLAGGTMTGAIVGTTATFTNSGSGVALGVTQSGSAGDGILIGHSAGRALNLNSSGTGFGILINNDTAATSAPFTIQKSGLSVITLTDAGAGSFSSSLTASSFIRSGGTAAQFLKANGSIDSNTYLTTTSAAATYAPLTGTGASGTWAISISGNAATATTATSATSAGTSTSTTFVSSPDGGRNPNTAPLPNTNPRSVSYNFAGIANITGATGNYAGVMTYSPWDGTSASTGDSSYQLAFCNFSGVNASGLPGLALRNGINSGWNATWYQMLHSGNYTSYSPSLTGSGASGTWAVRITGFANAGSQRLYSTDAAYNYDSANPYYGFLTYDGTYWLFKVSPASPDRVRVYRSDTSGTADNTNSISSATGGAYSWTGTNYFVSNGNTPGNSFPLQAYSNNGSGAVMSFHRAGAYAVNFGLDSDNVMRIGGWSAAVNRWQLDMSGNQTIAGTYYGSGAGLTGTAASLTAGAANSVAWTNVSGRPTTTSAFTNDSGFITSGNNVVGLYNSGFGNSSFNWYQTPSGLQQYTGSWASFLISNHGDGATYYNQTIIMPFWGVPQYMRKEGTVNVGPWTFWTTENLNPNSISGNFSASGSITSGGLMRVNASTNLYLDYNYGCSVVGVYASTRFQGVFAMGDAYKLAIDGTSPGNLYGISWSHPNAGGQATYLNDHGMMVMVNGVTYSAMSSNIWARGRVTANEDVYSTSGWFYSNNNAGWYNNTYGQGIRPAKANLTYGSIVNIGENFNGYGGYGITNTYNTLYMQNSGGDHGFFRDGGGGGWSFFYHQNYNCAGIGTDATDPAYSLHIIKYGGSNTGWIIWSDRRIKENIKTIDNALDKVLSLRGVYYNKIDDPNKERCVGYIAQEVMEVVPELVVYSEELDMYNMNYGPMVGMLTEAIKEQQSQIETLKEQVQTLLNHINNGI